MTMGLLTQPDGNQAAITAPTAVRPHMDPLLKAAMLAPSPDNNQPWRFVCGDNRLDVLVDPSRALPSDVNSMFDLTALGAAVENACIAAREHHLEPAVALLSEGDLPRGVRITWGGRDAKPDPLFEYIFRRHTSRRPYSRAAISAYVLEEITSQTASFSGVQVHWLTQRPAIRAFAWIVGKSDRLRFERESFHQELFRQLRFTREEAERTRDGLDLRALELPPLGGLVLRIIRNWRFLSAANLVGASRLLALPSVLPVVQSGAIGLLTVDQPGAQRFLDGGRAFQRLWLAATAAGLQLHPLGSLPIFLAHLDQLRCRELTSSQQTLARQVKQQFQMLAPDAGRTLQICFRIGYGRNASCRSLRRTVEKLVDT